MTGVAKSSRGMRKFTPDQVGQIQERTYVDAALALKLGEGEISSLPAQPAEITFFDIYPPPDQDIWKCRGKHTETNLRLREEMFSREIGIAGREVVFISHHHPSFSYRRQTFQNSNIAALLSFSKT